MPGDLSIPLPQTGQTLRLWTGPAPMSQGDEDADVPTLSIHRPSGKPSRAAMIVLPGGGYDSLAWEKEGTTPAAWLAEQGIFAAALKYRVAPKYHYPVPVLDATRAVRLIRYHAAEWNIDPLSIGVMGFSAGGHLAALLSTAFDDGNAASPDPIERVPSRPDLAVLLYSVINMAAFPHTRSRNNLIGPTPDPEILRKTSADLNVQSDSPPTYIFHTVEDGAVAVEHAIRYAQSLRRLNVPFELHLFERGPHGVGMAFADPVLGIWSKSCAAWMKSRGFIV